MNTKNRPCPTIRAGAVHYRDSRTRSDTSTSGHHMVSLRAFLTCKRYVGRGGIVRRPWVQRRHGERRLRVWMPYQGGSNRLWIKESLGPRMRPEWIKEAGRWEIARTHLKPLVAALIDRFGEVDVYLEFLSTDRCDIRCAEAVGDDCECSCMGENHGGAAYWKRWTQVGDTTLVELERVERHFLVRRADLIRA